VDEKASKLGGAAGAAGMGVDVGLAVPATEVAPVLGLLPVPGEVAGWVTPEVGVAVAVAEGVVAAVAGEEAPPCPTASPARKPMLSSRTAAMPVRTPDQGRNRHQAGPSPPPAPGCAAG
jgi:hypothetical protein